jgi:hypothetical protein
MMRIIMRSFSLILFASLLAACTLSFGDWHDDRVYSTDFMANPLYIHWQQGNSWTFVPYGTPWEALYAYTMHGITQDFDTQPAAALEIDRGYSLFNELYYLSVDQHGNIWERGIQTAGIDSETILYHEPLLLWPASVNQPGTVWNIDGTLHAKVLSNSGIAPREGSGGCIVLHYYHGNADSIQQSLRLEYWVPGRGLVELVDEWHAAPGQLPLSLEAFSGHIRID